MGLLFSDLLAVRDRSRIKLWVAGIGYFDPSESLVDDALLSSWMSAMRQGVLETIADKGMGECVEEVRWGEVGETLTMRLDLSNGLGLVESPEEHVRRIMADKGYLG